MIKSAKYLENGFIEVVLDDDSVATVPDDLGNRHRRFIDHEEITIEPFVKEEEKTEEAPVPKKTRKKTT